MIKKFFLLLILSLEGMFLSGCTLKKTPAALQIDTVPVANVFINGKLLGKTPYQASDLKPGETFIKLIPESTTTPLSTWEGKVTLNGGVLTLIERELASSEGASSGQILTLERTRQKKEASLSIISDPDGALVNIDGEAKGLTPINLENSAIGDHQITISKEGFKERTVKARTVSGFKLIVSVKLGEENGEIAVPTVSPSPSGSTEAGPEKPYVEIKETPTGWLRVREAPSLTATEAARVKPKEKYPLLEKKEGWFKIRYRDNKEGWISSQYAIEYQ